MTFGNFEPEHKILLGDRGHGISPHHDCSCRHRYRDDASRCRREDFSLNDLLFYDRALRADRVYVAERNIISRVRLIVCVPCDCPCGDQSLGTLVFKLGLGELEPGPPAPARHKN